MNGYEIMETFDKLEDDDQVSEKTNRDFKTTYQ
jgi:hypothetical protein